MKETDLEKQYEKLLNIKTTGRDDTKADTYRYPYEPTPYCVLERMANSGCFEKKNVLLDCGSGKGRVDFYMSYHTGCNSIGIEYDDRMYKNALLNKEQAAKGNRVSFVYADATKYEIPEKVDRIFFFNPFSETLLKTVIANIIKSYQKNEREILLLFYYPSDEYISFLMTNDNLLFVDEIECDDLFDGNAERERILIFSVI